MRMKRRHFLALGLGALAALCAALPAHSASFDGYGVVYLHGKGGWPGAMNGGILSSLKDDRRAGGDAGNAVVVPPQIRRDL